MCRLHLQHPDSLHSLAQVVEGAFRVPEDLVPVAISSQGHSPFFRIPAIFAWEMFGRAGASISSKGKKRVSPKLEENNQMVWNYGDGD